LKERVKVMLIIRALQSLVGDQRPGKKEFAYDYSGDATPEKLPPHQSDWDEANAHWIDFNEAVLKSNELLDVNRRERVAAAEEYSQFLLWVMVVSPLCFCPGCKVGVGPDHLVNALWPEWKRRAKEHWESGDPLESPPTLGNLAFACLADRFPDLPREAVAHGAAALVDHAVLAVKYDNVSELHARAVAEHLAVQLQPTPSDAFSSYEAVWTAAMSHTEDLHRLYGKPPRLAKSPETETTEVETET
jgi:hypothetical protein